MLSVTVPPKEPSIDTESVTYSDPGAKQQASRRSLLIKMAIGAGGLVVVVLATMAAAFAMGVFETDVPVTPIPEPLRPSKPDFVQTLTQPPSPPSK